LTLFALTVNVVPIERRTTVGAPAVTDLQIRRIPFRFDETTPLQWNPSNPCFGLMTDGVSILAIAFEKFIVNVLRDVIPTITDPEVAAEADAFLRQEAAHAKAHRLHLRALISQHPGLQSTVDDAIAKFDRLIETEPTELHLAYIADLEATFTPIFKLMLDNDETMFGPGDDRVASLFLWHFVEEIEHRSSGLIIYDAVVGKPWFRVRAIPKIVSHMADVFLGIMEGIDAHVPEPARMASAVKVASPLMWVHELRNRTPLVRRWSTPPVPPTAFAPVPTGEILKMMLGLVRSQVPGHSPARAPVPDFADRWFRAYAGGRDVTAWYSTADPSTADPSTADVATAS
jgi:predicted metal-dependent hydrolase